jgi:hypothetical protein
LGASGGSVWSFLALRSGGAGVSDKKQFPKPFAKLLFAARRATQPKFRRVEDTLHPEAMR